MKNFDNIIKGLTQSGLLTGFTGGVAGGALSGALMSKKGRSVGKSALKLGALAAIGTVAYKAYQSYSQKNAHQSTPDPSAPSRPSRQEAVSRYTPSEPKANLTYSPASISKQQFEKVIHDEASGQGQMLLLRAMIAAANADGHIDENERQRIYQQVDNLTLSISDKASLFDEVRKPLSLDALVNSVPNAETAVEVYAASVLAIDLHQSASVVYLDRLASSLMIPKELVSAIHQQASETA